METSFYNGIDLEKTCDVYNDCYNCTLANCGWNQNKTCSKDKSISSDDMTVQEFMIKGKKCADEQKLCDFTDDGGNYKT